MWGVPVAFIVGYAVARWFGDSVKNVINAVYKEIESILSEWL